MDKSKKTQKRDIGLAIKNIRMKKGLKQKQLVKKINPGGMAINTLSRIETGSYDYKISMLFKIANALDCDVSDFFESKKKDSNTAILEEILGEYRARIIELEKSKDK